MRHPDKNRDPLDRKRKEMFLKSCQILFLLSLAVVLLTGCNNKRTVTNTDSYEVTWVDTLSFNNHIIYTLVDSNDSEFVLISSKVNHDDTMKTLDSLEEIQVGHLYKLKLKEYDTYPELEYFVRSIANLAYEVHPDPTYDCSDSSNLLWSNDSFFKKVYYTNDVVGQYVRITQ